MLTFLLISFVTWGFPRIFCDLVNPVDECIQFTNCMPGLKGKGLDFSKSLTSCLNYDQKLSPAKVGNASGIQDVFLEMVPALVTTTFDSGGQVNNKEILRVLLPAY